MMAQLKKIRYQMNFDSNSHFAVAVLMGAAFFLRIAYYLGFSRPNEAGLWLVLTGLILPVLVEAAFMVLLRGVRLNAPGVYGILGMVYCGLLLLQTFQYADVVRTVLGILAYVICGGLLLGTVGGMLSKEIVVTATFLTIVVRFFVFDLGKYIFSLRLVAFMPEAASLCGLLALALFAYGLKAPQKKAAK